MLEPFAKCMAVSQDFRLKKEVRQHVFTYLIRQSDPGIAYEEAQEAKAKQIKRAKRLGTVKGGKKSSAKRIRKTTEDEDEEEADEPEELEEEEPAIEEEPVSDDEVDIEPDEDDAMLEMDDNDDDESHPDWGAKDPRAGGVDVVLPQLEPDWKDVADMLLKTAADKKVRSKNRKGVYHLVQW